ncbi:MAG: pyridoxamine 5'-phosphate oxidase [Candidatus Berkiellales bacterium]
MKAVEQSLTKSDLLKNPFDQFGLWFTQAKNKGELEPSAMTLATVNANYDVTARMLLLKSFDENGFVFFTNYDSPKAQALTQIPKAAMVFWWPLLLRQVRITGNVVLLDSTQSDNYFASRSKNSRLAAIASKQSEVIPNRETLIEQFQAQKKRYENIDDIPRPAFWGGYVLIPHTIEFWQGREHRLHDRFEYRKDAAGAWHIVQLSP